MNLFNPQDEQTVKAAEGAGMFSPQASSNAPNKVQEAQGFLRNMKPENAEALMVAGLSLIQGNDAGTAGLQALGHRNARQQQATNNQFRQGQQDLQQSQYADTLAQREITNKRAERVDAFDQQKFAATQDFRKFQRGDVETRRGLEQQRIDMQEAGLLLEEQRLGIQQQNADSQTRTSSRSASPKVTEADKKIASLVRQGVSREQAENITYGVEDTKINENTGAIIRTNSATGEVVELPVSSYIDDYIPSPEPGRTLWDYSKHGTGLASWAQSAVDVPKSMLGLDIDKVNTQSRHALTTESRRLTRALAMNPRFPVAEMKAIEAEVDLKPKLIDTPELMQQRMISIDRSLKLRVKQYQRDADNPNLPVQLREDRKQALSHLENYLSLLAVPQGEMERSWTTEKESRYQELMKKQRNRGRNR